MSDPFKSKMSDEQFGKHQFKVALSFPGKKHRQFARKVANYLAEELGHESIFFDEWYRVQLIGKNGDIKLHEIYSQRSNYVVPFFSQHYSTLWCEIEWDSIRGMLAERKKDNVIIAIRMDNSAIPGWNFTDFDVRREKLTTAQVGEIILHKLRNNEPNPNSVLETDAPVSNDKFTSADSGEDKSAIEEFDQTLRSKVKSLISETLDELSQVELDELSTLLNPSLSVPKSAKTDDADEDLETDLSEAMKLASKLVKSVFPESYFLQFLIQTYCQIRDGHHKQDKLESAMKEMINWLFPLQLPTEILQEALQQFNATGAVLITELIERPGTAEILISALGGSKLNTRDKPVRKISFENPPLDKPTKEDKELLVFQEITKKLDPGVPLVNLADKKSCMAQIKGVLRLDLNDPSRSTKFILIDLPKSDPSRKSSTNSQSRVKQYEDVLREISENLGGLLFVELTPQENEAFIAEEAFIAQCLNMLVIT